MYNPWYFDWYGATSYFDSQARKRYPNSRYSKGVSGFNSKYDIRMTKGQQNRLRYEMSGWPVVGGMMQSGARLRQLEDYMALRGITWEDLKYPELLSGGRTPTGNALQVSSNIFRLYR